MIDEPYAKAAVWSKRLGLFAVPVAAIAVLTQRSGRLAVEPAFAAIGSAFLLAVLAILLGLVAFAIIWFRGNRGAAQASLGIAAGVLVLAAPAYFVARAWQLPPIVDVATDPAQPPAFVFAGAERGPGDNPLAYPGESAAVAQMAAFADIAPLRISSPPDEVHALALQLVEKRGWRVLDTGNGQTRIEAVATSLILRLADDVVIEIRPDGAGARVDMRSAARIGTYDLGRNAARIRDFLADLAVAAG